MTGPAAAADGPAPSPDDPPDHAPDDAPDHPSARLPATATVLAGAPVDARGATGVQVGEGNTQIVYSYTGLTFGDGVVPPPLTTFSGQVESPYRGLAAFGERDAAFFFGREAAAGEILGRMAEHARRGGVVVVSGVSGAGKSSLLNAGVLPRLRGAGLTGLPGSAGWPCLVFTPASRPVDDLAVRLAALSGVAASAVRRELALDPAGFALLARQAALVRYGAGAPDAGRATEPPRLVLVVDQFEQVFTQCRDEAQRRGFVAALSAAATDDRSPSGLVVVGVRADFEAACAEHPELVDAVQQRYLVTSMTERQLRMAITEPAKAAGSGVDPDLVDALLLDVRLSRTSGQAAAPAARVTGAGVLPLVSHALDRAWRNRTGDRLTLADYERTGGVEGAVAASAQQAYDGLTPTQQRLARQVFLRLTVTSVDGVHTADRVRVPDLVDGRDEEEQRDLRAVLDAFVAERLLTLAADTVEISHEALFTAWPLLRDTWLADAQADRIVRARLDATVAEWLAHGKDVSYLYAGSLLDAAASTARRIREDPARHAPLGASAVEFLDASTRTARRRVRRRRTLTAVLAVLVLAFGTSAVLATLAQRTAGRQRDRAQAAARVATARQLASTATGELDSDLGQAMLLAATSWNLDHGVEGRSALWQAATASPHLVRFVPLGATATALAVSDDGSAVAVGDAHGRVTLMTPAGRVVRRLRLFTRPVEGVAVSDGAVRLLATDGRRVLTATGSHTAPVGRVANGVVSAVAVSGDGSREVFVGVGPGFPQTSTIHSMATDSGDDVTRTFPAALDKTVVHDGALTALDTSYGRWVQLAEDLSGPPRRGDAGFGAHNYASALSPDGGSFTYSNSGATVPVWRTHSTGQRFQRPEAYGREPGVVPQAMALSPGGERMPVADSGTVYVSEPGGGTPYVSTLTGLSSLEVSQLAFVGSGSRLVSTSADQLAVWDLRQFSRVATRQPAKVPFGCVACSGPLVAVSSGSRVAYETDSFLSPVIHDLADGSELWAKDDTLTTFGPQLWSARSPSTLVQGYADGTLALIDGSTGDVRRSWPSLPPHTALVYLRWAEDGRRLVDVDARGVTTVRDATSGRVTRVVPPLSVARQANDLRAGKVAVSDDARYLATVVGHRVLVADLVSRRQVARISEPSSSSTFVTVRFSAGHRLWVFGNGQADERDARTGRRTRLVQLSRFLEAPVVDPSGSMLAYQRLDGRLVLVDVRTGREVGGFQLPASVEALKSGYDFSPDGRDLVVVTEGSGDRGNVARWHVSVRALHDSVCSTAGRRLTRAELRAASPQLSAGSC